MDEAGNLLEDSWFFENLLDTKPRTISRCYSDLGATFITKNPNLSPNLMPFVVQSNQEDVMIKNEPKNSSVFSKKQLPVAHLLPNSIKTQSFSMKNPNPNLNFPTSAGENDQEYEEDQESEFSLGRLIRQASMNTSHTTNPAREISKEMTENVQKKPELDKEKINEVRKKSKNTKNNGKNKNGGAPKIPQEWVDRSSSEDMKAKIKFWAKAVASNVHQKCW